MITIRNILASCYEHTTFYIHSPYYSIGKSILTHTVPPPRPRARAGVRPLRNKVGWVCMQNGHSFLIAQPELIDLIT